MLASGLWRREWLELRATRRTFLLGVMVPLALSLPVVAGNLPPLHQAAYFTLLVALMAALGAGRRVWQLRESGVLLRLSVIPVSPYRLLLQFVLMRTCLDFVMLLPFLFCLMARHMPQPGTAALLAYSVFPAVCVAEIIGMLAGSLAGAAGEMVLYSLVMLLPCLLVSGVFTPEPPFAALGTAAAAVLPFAQLNAALRGVMQRSLAWPAQPIIASGAPAVLCWMGGALLFLRRRLDQYDRPSTARRKR